MKDFAYISISKLVNMGLYLAINSLHWMGSYGVIAGIWRMQEDGYLKRIEKPVISCGDNQNVFGRKSLSLIIDALLPVALITRRPEFCAWVMTFSSVWMKAIAPYTFLS